MIFYWFVKRKVKKTDIRGENKVKSQISFFVKKTFAKVDIFWFYD